MNKNGENATENAVTPTENWEDDPEDEDETARYFLESNVAEETSKISELEMATLRDPSRIDLYLQLVAKFVNSQLANGKQLGLAALSEALERHPRSATLWRRYLLLYNEVHQNGATTSEWKNVMEFAEEHVELDVQFWNTRVNLIGGDKSATIEKYISRLLDSETESEKTWVRNFQIKPLKGNGFNFF